MNVGTLTISLTARTASLAKAGAQVKLFEKGVIASVQRINTSIASIGMAFSALTIPIAAVAGGSVKMFAEFEFSLARVEGLVGIAHEQTMLWGKEVLQLSKTIGKSANDMGEALYFVSSAGIRGAATMEVVKASAQASAAGMGDTQVIASLLTSVMNAYGESNISAAESMDILVTAVREGKVEAPDLITALGKVLPISSAMGASFNEVGAAIAAMTRTGTPARTAGMMVQRMLFSLQKPGMAATKTIESMGSSFKQLRDIIRTEKGGILKVLLQIKSLTDKFGEEKMARIFPNIRAYLPALDLLGKNLEKNKSIWVSMLEPAGNFQNLIDATAGTFQYKFMVAINAAREALIQIGHTFANTLIPVIHSFAEKMRQLSNWWTSIPRETQQLIVKFTLLAGTLGPLLIMLSALMGVITTVISAIWGLSAALWAIVTNPITVTIAAIISAVFALGIAAKSLKETWSTTGKSITLMLGYMYWNFLEWKINILQIIDDVLSKFKAIGPIANLLFPGLGSVLANLDFDVSDIIKKNNEELLRVGKILLELDEEIANTTGGFSDAFDRNFNAVIDRLGGYLSTIKNKVQKGLTDMFDINGVGAGSFPDAALTIEAQMKALREKLKTIAASELEFGPTLKQHEGTKGELSGITDLGSFGGLAAKFTMDQMKLRETSIAMGEDFDYIGKKIALFNSFVLAGEKIEMWTPEQIEIMKQAYAEITKMTEAQKAANATKDVGLKLMQAWKTAGNALVSVFQQLGDIIGGAFGEAINKMTPYISLVTKIITLLKAVGVIEKINAAKKIASVTADTIATTANTTAKVTNATVGAVSNTALSASAAGLAISNAIAAGAWVPFPGNLAAMASGVAGVMTGLATIPAAAGLAAVGLADGGIIPPGYNNDTFPAMLSTNEAVIPLDKLPQLMGMNRNGENQKVTFIIEGRQLEGVLVNQGIVNRAF